MPTWLSYALLTIVFWGFWAFLPKIATRTLDVPTTMFYYALSSLAVAVGILTVTGFKLNTNLAGIGWAALIGVCAAGGLLCYLQAIARHPMAVVVMVTALYPMVTLALSLLLLREKLSPQQWVGVLFALVAIVLMATSGSSAKEKELKAREEHFDSADGSPTRGLWH